MITNFNKKLYVSLTIALMLRLYLGKSLLDQYLGYSLADASKLVRIHPGIYIIFLILTWLLISGTLKIIFIKCRWEINY